MRKARQLLASTAMRLVAPFDGLSPAPHTIVPESARQAARNMVAQLVASGQLVVGDEMLKRSRDSAAMLDYWDKTDAIVDGEDAVKTMHSTFLPKFEYEEQEDYQVRCSLVKFTNVYRDIVENLATKPFEEDVSLGDSGEEDTKPPQEIEDFSYDVDGAGNDITSFAATTMFNGINSAIDWIFVDFPTETDTAFIRTRADAKAAGVRPYWSHVLGRNILEARARVINGKETLTYIRMFEPGDGSLADHVRVFERANDGVVTWKLYVKTDQIQPSGKTQFKLEAAGVVTIDVIPLIPFITGRRDGRTFRIFPAMKDAADLQVQLYQQESGLKFSKTISAYPMLTGNGINTPMEADGKTPKKIKVGPMRVLTTKPDGNGNYGEWSYIQPDAGILKFLADDVKETIQQLRELGRQPLTAQSGNLTVITTAVAASKSRTAVGAWAVRLGNVLEEAMLLTAKWLKINYDPIVNVFDEFDDYIDPAADVTALQQARTTRDISRKTYLQELQRRKVISQSFDPEADLAELLAETPTGADLEDDDDTTKEPPK